MFTILVEARDPIAKTTTRNKSVDSPPIQVRRLAKGALLFHMFERTIAIGDIHGCFHALEKTLELLEPKSTDLVITLGDYIDRGPNTREVLNRLIELSRQCELVPLLGNHELMMLAARDDESHLSFWMQCGGRETIESYGESIDDIPETHWEFISKCLPYYETESHLFVHANYNYRRPLSEFTETELFWRHLNGTPPPPHISGKKVILGHTPHRGRIMNMNHVACIDTYCFGDGCLTAMDVNTGDIWQADKFGRIWATPSSRN